jgi:AcrR family transcriptional regulator
MAHDTRERIMDAAMRLFGERGVAGTPVTSIEAAAGLSAGSGSFYRHFKDKSELLTALIEREMTRVKKDPSAQLRTGPGGPPAEALARQLLADMDFLRGMLPLIAILMWERGSERVTAPRVRELLLERSVELGVLDLLWQSPTPTVSDDPAAAATVMLSAMIGYFLTVEFFGEPPAGVDAERFTTTLARLLTAPGPGVDPAP